MSQFFDLCDDRTPNVYTTQTLYKLDSLGKLRTWRMELDDNGRYRTLAGLADGKQATSEWTVPVGKQGRNQKEQGEFEVRSAVKHQLDREYHESADTVGTPKMIEPMLAKTYDKWPGQGYAQPKLDGIRCIMNNEGCGMWTRQGQPIVAVPHLRAACQPLFDADPDLILDGELYNHELREDFGAISSIVRKKNPTAEQIELAEAVMQYHVYDIISRGDDSFIKRFEHLNHLVKKLDCGWVILVDAAFCSTQSAADLAYAKSIEEGYEGGMYRLDQPYERGRRSKNLLKRKEFITREFPVDQVLEGKGNWAGAAKTFVLRNDPEYAEVDNPSFGKGLFGAGVRGSKPHLQEVLQDYKRTDGTGTATVRYFMLSPDGVPRFPVVIDYQPEGRND